MSEDFVVGIIMATGLEAAPFIKGLSLRPCENVPFAVYENHRIRLIISGIGKANAAMATAYLIIKYHPLGVFNLGAAGATGPDILGECYHISKVIEPDRPCLRSDQFHIHIPRQLEDFPTAVLATRDSAVTELAERSETAAYADLVDMEGAAVVQTCRRFRTDCYLFKFVSDSSAEDDTVNIRKNIEQYRDVFYTFFQDSVLPLIRRRDV